MNFLAVAPTTAPVFDWTTFQARAAFAVSVVSAVAAFLSWRANREKIRVDLFVRRYGLYERLRKTAAKIMDVKDDPDDMGLLYREVEDLRMESSFLFRKDVEDDIEAVVKQASELTTHIDDFVSGANLDMVYKSRKTEMSLNIDLAVLKLSRKMELYIDFRNVGRKRRAWFWPCVRDLVLSRWKKTGATLQNDGIS